MFTYSTVIYFPIQLKLQHKILPLYNLWKVDKIANFKTHVTGSIISGAMFTTFALPNSELNIKVFGIAVLLSFIGGILPDIDSSTSKSQKIVSASISCIFSLVYIILTHDITFRNLLDTLGMFTFINLLLRWVIFKFTIHRGIFHSIPVMFIWSLTLSWFSYSLLNIDAYHSVVYGGILGIGFLSHLLLDELFSVNLAGLKIKKSFGSALKLFSRNLTASILAYIGAIFLLTINPPMLPVIIQLNKNILHNQQYYSQIINNSVITLKNTHNKFTS